MPKHEQLQSTLQQEERKGLKLQFQLRIVVGAVLVLAAFTIGRESAVEHYGTLTLFVLYGLVSLLTIRRLDGCSNLLRINIVGIVLDLIALVLLSMILYWTMDPQVTPFSFILKSDIYPISLMLLIFHSISYHQRVIIYSALSLLFFNIMLLILSLIAVPVTHSFSEGFTSYRVNLDFEMGKLLLFILIAMTTYYISQRFRNTLHRSAQAEVDRSQLQRYFSPDIAAQILENDTKQERGSEIEVAVLFSDLEAFTSISEQISPSEVLELLSEYHELMVEAIFAHQGSLDKFIGDAILATFGVPTPGEMDADHAIDAALAMNQALEQLNRKRSARGLIPLRHRIGVHYGKVIAGNIGSAKRLEYTVLGDTVNTAHRLEEQCKVFDTGLIFSRELVNRLKTPYTLKTLGSVTVKGRSQSVELFTL